MLSEAIKNYFGRIKKNVSLTEWGEELVHKLR